MLRGFPLYSYIPAKDVGRARAFYEAKLGLTAKEEVAGGVTFELGNGTACSSIRRRTPERTRRARPSSPSTTSNVK